MKPHITINEEDPKNPVCPHCAAEVTTISARKVESVLGVRYLYYCGRCSKVLGVSHRKGFWMG